MADAPVEEQLAQLKREVDAAGAAAAKAQHEAEVLGRTLDKTARRVREELTSAVETVMATTRRQALSGVHETRAGAGPAGHGAAVPGQHAMTLLANTVVNGLPRTRHDGTGCGLSGSRSVEPVSHSA